MDDLVTVAKTVVFRPLLHKAVEKGGVVFFYGLGFGIRIVPIRTNQCIVELVAHEQYDRSGIKTTPPPKEDAPRKTVVTGEVVI